MILLKVWEKLAARAAEIDLPADPVDAESRSYLIQRCYYEQEELRQESTSGYSRSHWFLWSSVASEEVSEA